jgi:hypothetical protein
MEFTMRVWEFEQAVWHIDHLRLVIRASRDGEVADFTQVNGAAAKTSLTEYLKTRIEPRINGSQYIVIDGNGETPHGKTSMETLRQSYSH